MSASARRFCLWLLDAAPEVRQTRRPRGRASSAPTNFCNVRRAILAWPRGAETPGSDAFAAREAKVQRESPERRPRNDAGNRLWRDSMRKINKPTALGIIGVAATLALLDGEAAWRAAWAGAVQGINAHVVALNIPGASAIAQIGTFLKAPPPPPPVVVQCANPIPSKFPSYIQPG